MPWTPISPWRLGTVQKVTAGASSAQSSAVGDQTYAVMITCMTANVNIAIGPNPTASASTWLVKTTDQPLVLKCAPGDKVAYIQNSSGGVLYIAEVSH
jgi:hypothetical protein